jgi:hypothetical protein
MFILKFPDEILHLIISFLPNRDVKNVRLTNRRMAANSKLRIERVFISPNYRNIEVFLAVARHSYFRNQVKEIIWDDARFLGLEEDEDVEWTEEQLAKLKMDPHESFAIYRQLFEDQEDIIRDGSDIEAFREGLSAFSSLKSITVTCEEHAHEKPMYPLRYPSPMIRSFPPNFEYPIRWRWGHGAYDDRIYTYDDRMYTSWGELRCDWRGFCVVLDELANHDRRISELIIDVNHQQTGIPYEFFHTESEDLTNFETICGRGLKRLDLAFHVSRNASGLGLAALSTGYLRRTLSRATSLEYFSIHSSVPAYIVKRCALRNGPQGRADILKLIPTEHWPNLRHLTLSSFLLKSAEFLDFLRRVSSTVKSLEFIDLALTEKIWAEFLPKLKDDLQWRGHHPEVAMAETVESNRKLWIKEDFARFLDGGDNPFVRDGVNEDRIQQGFGVLEG